jgi:hypothetical protein
MRLQIIPREQTVLIPTKKSNDQISSSLMKLFGNKRSVKLMTGHADFVIERTLWNSNRSLIVGSGHIENANGNTVRLKVIAKDSYLIYFGLFWYMVNVFMLLFMIYIFIVDRTFSFFILLPFVFMFIGYGVSTATLQGAMDEMIIEVRRAVK